MPELVCRNGVATPLAQPRGVSVDASTLVKGAAMEKDTGKREGLTGAAAESAERLEGAA